MRSVYRAGVVVVVVAAVVAAVVIARKRRAFFQLEFVRTLRRGEGASTGPLVCSLATGAETLAELRLMAWSLRWFHPDARLVVMTDSRTPVAAAVPWATVVTCDLMALCEGRTKAAMERAPGVRYANLFTDFTYAKALVLEHALVLQHAGAGGAWFLDADIVLMAPLPDVPEAASLALSPHYCNPELEARTGRYNAGMLFVRDPRHVYRWRQAGYADQRFYEQAPLEAAAAAARANEELLELTRQDNVGWWLFFSEACHVPRTAEEARARLAPGGAGLLLDGAPLRSLHMHTAAAGARGPTREFLDWVRGLLAAAPGVHAAALLAQISSW